jgi:hypothetical protein
VFDPSEKRGHRADRVDFEILRGGLAAFVSEVSDPMLQRRPSCVFAVVFSIAVTTFPLAVRAQPDGAAQSGPAVAPPEPPVAPAEPKRSVPALAVEAVPSTWNGRRISGVAVASAGVGGLAVGSVLGVLTLKKLSDARTGDCNTALTVCNQTGLDMISSAMATAHGSTASLAVGGAALVVGVVLFATAPSPADAPKSGLRVTVGPVAGADVTGLELRGGW